MPYLYSDICEFEIQLETMKAMERKKRKVRKLAGSHDFKRCCRTDTLDHPW